MCRMLILFSCKYLSVGLSFTVFILLGLLFWRINVLIKIRLRFECETIFRQHKGVALATDIMSRRSRCIFWCKTELRFKNFGRTIKTVVSRCCDNPQSTRYAVTNALNVHIGRRLQSVVACLRLVARTVFDRLRCQTTHTRKHTHTHTHSWLPLSLSVSRRQIADVIGQRWTNALYWSQVESSRPTAYISMYS